MSSILIGTAVTAPKQTLKIITLQPLHNVSHLNKKRSLQQKVLLYYYYNIYNRLRY